jgi:hypothetical protein
MRKNTKRVKNRDKSHKAPKDIKPPPGISANGMKIWQAMKMAKIRGNYKDYVLFVGDQMLDRYGTYRVQRSNALPGQQIMVLHKARLAAVAGAEVGSRFWNMKWKHRTNYGLEEYNASRRGRAS